MIFTAGIWLLLNILSIIVLAFYSMTEMACVSFNRIRLHYYLSKGNKSAIQLNELLENPAKLFGTTLIGVNVAMFFGSECARQFHAAIGLPPDFAPFSQVFLVVIFGELAPMFAARHYAEHVGMLGAPVLYFSSKLLSPITFILNIISKCFIYLFNRKEIEENVFISQEELLKILETKLDGQSDETSGDDFNLIVYNTFTLRKRSAKEIMIPLDVYPKIPSNSTIANVRMLLKKNQLEFIPIYHSDFKNIIKMAFPRDLLRTKDSQNVCRFAHQPWFVPEETSLMQVLHNFKRNNQKVAVIIDKKGSAIGFLFLNDVLEVIFGKSKTPPSKKETKHLTIINRTLPGSMSVKDFNEQFQVNLYPDQDMSLSELLSKELGHMPEPGDTIYLPPFEIIAKETSLLEVKVVEVKTRIQ